jgi:glycosyltransferase involved in cell wall biosynthesis
MPARNTGRFIGEAIASVLAQQGVDFELVVVDDGSEDDTVEVVRRFRSPRLRLIETGRRRGIAHCHNVVLEQSAAPFLAHVDSDDWILAGALARMLAAVRDDPRVGQAYCHYDPVDAAGRMAAAWQRHRAFLVGQRPPGFDYRRGLLVHGMVVNPLRTYRREVFDVVGHFDERLRYAVDYDMAVRIAERYEIALVPEFLYRQRLREGNMTEGLRLQALRSWWTRARILRRRLRAAGGCVLGRRPSEVYALMLLGLAHALGLPRALRAGGRWSRRLSA